MSVTRVDPRARAPLLAGWEFRRGRVWSAWLDGGKGAVGEPVELPHCWNDTDEFRENVSYARGWGAYRLRFDAGAWAGRRLLRSEGFYGVGELRLNGRRVAPLDGQYLGFTFDVTGLLRPAGNVLGIRVTNRCPGHVLPGIDMPDFLLHGGLSGRMWIEDVPAVRLAEDALRVRYRLDGLRADCRLGAALAGDAALAAAGLRIRWTVLDPGGRVAATAISPPCGGSGAVPETALRLDAVERWDPDRPVLYTVEARLEGPAGVLDCAVVRTGFRVAEFRHDAGFFLNGRRLWLHGVNRHECLPGFGRALPLRMHREDAVDLRAHGCNFVRLSHYPQHPAFLDACDELGLLVYAELASWKSVRTGRWLRAAERQLEAMIRRDRHHPSVVLWGLGNESRSRPAYLRLGKVVAREDPDRPTIYAENHLHRARRARTTGIVDVWGCNYELDALEPARAAARLRCVVVSECCNEPETQRGDGEAELRQARAVQELWLRLRGASACAGYALWCWNDYPTLRKRRYRRYSGIVDAWREPKLAARLMAIHHATELRVHLEPGLLDGLPVVWVLSNASQLSIWANEGHWEVSAPSALHAVPVTGRGALVSVRADRGAASHEATIEMPGDPEQLELLESPAPGGAPRDCAIVRARVLDAAGRLCHLPGGLLRVAAEGSLRVRSHLPDGCVEMAAGVGRVFLQAPVGGGAGRIVARFADLPAATLDLTLGPRGLAAIPGDETKDRL